MNTEVRLISKMHCGVKRLTRYEIEISCRWSFYVLNYAQHSTSRLDSQLGQFKIGEEFSATFSAFSSYQSCLAGIISGTKSFNKHFGLVTNWSKIGCFQGAVS